MNIKYKIFLLGVLLSTNIQAAILNKEEAAKADLTVLEDEVELFKSISMGINLSIAHCEGNDRCSLPIEEREVQQLVKTLEHRIDSLAARQSEIDDIIGFNKVLSSYISLRDSYTSFIEKIQSIIAEYKDKNEAFQYGSEPNFPVEAEIDEELLKYLKELSLFEDEELEDDEESGDSEDLPQTEEIEKSP